MCQWSYFEINKYKLILHCSSQEINRVFLYDNGFYPDPSYLSSCKSVVTCISVNYFQPVLSFVSSLSNELNIY